MIHDVPTLVSWVSEIMTLLPGDIILTGTPAGVSPIVEGDVVQCSIDGIGEIINTVENR
jgi:2-keto-4-pentenoate hydratase/2-oxohepta-3-ene-1,7-dioic acid hydratase in catechol pathway